MFIKYILLVMTVALCFIGCGKESARENQSEEQTDTEETYIICNYDYTGYEDECTGWSGYEQFVDQDYDNDKLIDRVYKEYKEDTDCCHYRIEFGNGDVIDRAAILWFMKNAATRTKKPCCRSRKAKKDTGRLFRFAMRLFAKNALKYLCKS